MQKITGKYVDIEAGRIFSAEITIENEIISSVQEISSDKEELVMLPGFIDAHVHVESSMLVPSEFARLAVIHGTVATVSDPHEIANVLGMEGVDLMIRNGAQVPFHFFFGAPSCVPATPFETAGARLDADQVGQLLARPEILYLSEMMDHPGVLNGSPEVMSKIAHAQKAGKPVDGHAPGYRGADAARYAAAGISTDHECFTAEEALDKLAAGMWVQIREGSAARNFDALHHLLHDHHERMMFCSDDKHPDGLVEGHIDMLCRRAVAAGIDVFKVLRAACINPILHYRLPVGRLRVGDPADLIMVHDLQEFKVARTYIRGQLVAQDGRSLIDRVKVEVPNNFHCTQKEPVQFQVNATDPSVLAIEAFDGQLITGKKEMRARLVDNTLLPDVEQDLLKIAVVDRYHNGPPAVGWITNFGLKKGAIASSVAHDSHNIVAVGTSDEELCAAVNAVIMYSGGVSMVNGPDVQVLPLPVGGIMSDGDAWEVAGSYAEMDRAAKGLGSTLSAPYMTLSFMALLVIPHLKMSDRGLFDGDSFTLVEPVSGPERTTA
jgi:adenine deaminase